jgi:predicted enzyme related to lactoylglutathione lyase
MSRSGIRYVHTNIIAQDWQKLARFYIDVFGCKPVYPERDLKGVWVDQLTGVTDAHIRGIHLELPGYISGGPTLEIFQYNRVNEAQTDNQIHQFGLRHLAFQVNDVAEITAKVIASGGKTYGQPIRQELTGLGSLIAIYVTDPEENIIELQNWEK